MKRSRIFLQLVALALFMMVAAPGTTYAQTSCVDNYLRCLNSATAYSGLLFQLAEVECGLSYTGCLASKLKFW